MRSLSTTSEHRFHWSIHRYHYFKKQESSKITCGDALITIENHSVKPNKLIYNQCILKTMLIVDDSRALWTVNTDGRHIDSIPFPVNLYDIAQLIPLPGQWNGWIPLHSSRWSQFAKYLRSDLWILYQIPNIYDSTPIDWKCFHTNSYILVPDIWFQLYDYEPV